jgi:hypothetical protein
LCASRWASRSATARWRWQGSGSSGNKILAQPVVTSSRGAVRALNPFLPTLASRVVVGRALAGWSAGAARRRAGRLRQGGSTASAGRGAWVERFIVWWIDSLTSVGGCWRADVWGWSSRPQITLSGARRAGAATCGHLCCFSWASKLRPHYLTPKKNCRLSYDGLRTMSASRFDWVLAARDAWLGDERSRGRILFPIRYDRGVAAEN